MNTEAEPRRARREGQLTASCGGRAVARPREAGEERASPGERVVWEDGEGGGGGKG